MREERAEDDGCEPGGTHQGVSTRRGVMTTLLESESIWPVAFVAVSVIVYRPGSA